MTARQFAIELDREWAETLEDVHEVVGLIGLQALRGAVEMSRVDTGRFRGNWQAGVEDLPAGVIAWPEGLEGKGQSYDPGGQSAINRAIGLQTEYMARVDFPVIWVTNNLEYAEYANALNSALETTIANIEAQFADVEV